MLTTTNQVLYLSFKNFVKSAMINFFTNAPADREWLVSYHHEPEGGGGSAGPDMPASTFRDRNALMRQYWAEAGAPAHVKLVSTLMGFTYRTPTRNPEDWYVDTTTFNGEIYKVFDILSCDQYDPGYKNNKYSDFGQLNTDLVAFAQAKGLPIGFGELGSAIGPLRTTNLTLRRAQILDGAQWCIDNAGTGPGKVYMAAYWDVVANSRWQPGNPNYDIYGSIPTAQYTLDMLTEAGVVLRAEVPGTRAGQVAYGAPAPDGDTVTAAAWRDLCLASRAYHGIS